MNSIPSISPIGSIPWTNLLLLGALGIIDEFDPFNFSHWIHSMDESFDIGCPGI